MSYIIYPRGSSSLSLKKAKLIKINPIFKNIHSDTYLVFSPTIFENQYTLPERRKIKSYTEILRKNKSSILNRTKQKQYKKHQISEQFLYQHNIFPITKPNSTLIINNKYHSYYDGKYKKKLNKMITQACILRTQKQKNKIQQLLKNKNTPLNHHNSIIALQQNTKITILHKKNQSQAFEQKDQHFQSDPLQTKKSNSLPKIFMKTTKNMQLLHQKNKKNFSTAIVENNMEQINPWDFDDEISPLQF